MILKILWEALSVLLLLYGVYLFYVFTWFSISEILRLDITISKIIAGILSLGILGYSSFKWFKKKHEEINKLEEKASEV